MTNVKNMPFSLHFMGIEIAELNHLVCPYLLRIRIVFNIQAFMSDTCCYHMKQREVSLKRNRHVETGALTLII